MRRKGWASMGFCEVERRYVDVKCCARFCEPEGARPKGPYRGAILALRLVWSIRALRREADDERDRPNLALLNGTDSARTSISAVVTEDRSARGVADAIARRDQEWGLTKICDGGKATRGKATPDLGIMCRRRAHGLACMNDASSAVR